MIIEIDSFEGTRTIDAIWQQAEVDIDNIRALTDLRLKGSVDASDGRLVFSGVINGKVEADCSRCLKAFEVPLNIEVNAVYVRPELFSAESESELEADDLDVDVALDGKIDCDEVIREQVLLELPVKMLCDQECAGLCDTCGTDLNEEHCKCGSENIDPRWAALKELK